MTNILSGYSSQLPTDTILGSIIIAIDSGTAYGASQGEPVVNLPRTYDNMTFDGKMAPVVGLDRVIEGVPSIDATLMEINATKALDLEPGATTASSGGIVTITPPEYGQFLPGSAYKENVRAFFRRGGGGVVCVEFNWALFYVETIQGASADKGQVKIHIEGRQAADAASLGVRLHTIKLAADIATIVAADP